MPDKDGYGAIEAPDREARTDAAARRSSRRRAAGKVSGHQLSRCQRPAASRQRTKASGPRQATVASDAGLPSIVTGRPSPGQNQACAGLRDSRRASEIPYASTAMANGQAQGRGISEATTENPESDASASIAAISHRDGRHSSRQLADPFEKCGDFGIFGDVVAHEPAPELIVFGIQQL